jgi:hypothetical protein
VADTHVVSRLAWGRLVSAVEKVRDRLRRTASALEAADIPYAVIGGNAVAAWVAEMDEAAVRTTRDVDILLRRSDLDRARLAMREAGFAHRHAAGIDMVLDGPGARARDAVHVVFAGERVRPTDLEPAPDVSDLKPTHSFRVVSLEALVRMKLTAFRDKDRVHLRDIIDVGLVDGSWIPRLSTELAQRLRTLLESPEG